MNFSSILSALLFFGLAYSSKAFSSTWSGRFTLGSYTSLERFADASATGSDKNDFQIFSSRFFVRGERLGGGGWEFTLDVRDKHDLFDRLDRERLQLTSRNEFQLRRISLHHHKKRDFWGVQVGRFGILETGNSFVDGAQLEQHFSTRFYTTVFGGLNPQVRGRPFLKTDTSSQVWGVTGTYQSQMTGWSRNLFWTQGYVEETFRGTPERKFIAQNAVYQWGPDSRLFSLIYYDLVPRAYLQNGTLSWQQAWSTVFISDVTLSHIDVIEYFRRQNVLEQLASSPYSEASLRTTWRLDGSRHRLYALFSSGERRIDGLSRQVAEVGWVKSQFFSPAVDFYIAGGTRKNFTSDDLSARMGLGYFRRRWEFNLDASYELQKNVNGTIFHPLMAESSLSFYFNQKSFLTVSGQTASNEQVKIHSLFVKYGYRFGNREVAPLRDGAPPRGPL